MIRRFWRWLTLADLHEEAVAQMAVKTFDSCAERGHWFMVRSSVDRVEYSACCAEHLIKQLKDGGSYERGREDTQSS